MEPLIHQSTYALTRPVRDLVAGDRERGHIHVLSAYRSGIGPSPRHQLGLLWHVGSGATLTVQAGEMPQWPGKLGEVQATKVIDSPVEGAVIELVVDRSCQKTPPSRVPLELRAELERKGPDGKKLAGKAYRSRTVVVPAPERQEWATARLAAIGLAPEKVTVGELRFAGLGGKRRGIPYVTLHARARVMNPTAFATALYEGTGKGRNYGLGLIRIQPAS